MCLGAQELVLVLLLFLSTRNHPVDNQAAWELQQCMNASHRGAKVENLSLRVYILHTPYNVVQHLHGRHTETHSCREERGSVSDAGLWKIISFPRNRALRSQSAQRNPLPRKRKPEQMLQYGDKWI